jgi:hypothetical protein
VKASARFARSLAVSWAVLALAMGACASGSTEAPHLADPAATARGLVVRFFTFVENKDVAGLQRFLSPAFQVQRADGSASAKAQYLTQLPSVTNFQITNLVATQDRSTLVVRYLATVEGLVNGKPYTPGPAPRLSVFSWSGEAWQLAAHANFNPLAG